MDLKSLLTLCQQTTLSAWQQYQRDRCLQAAGNLAFTTVVSIVPMAIVMSSMMLKFQAIGEASQRVQAFLLEKLLPSTADNLREMLPEINATAQNITVVSLLILLLTAVLLLRSIDDTINAIWQLHPKTNKSFRLHYYLLMIIFTPVLLGLSLSITSYLKSLPYINAGLNTYHVGYYLLVCTPVILNMLMFTLLIKFSPRVPVSLRHAGIGAIVAALLFELAKQLFSYYVVNFPNYQIIYGALSFIPIFLIWIYISWAIVLFGAELSYAVWLGRDKYAGEMKKL